MTQVRGAYPNVIPLSFLRGIHDSHTGRLEPVARGAAAQVEQRRVGRSQRLGAGTLACARCDAPVALSGPVSPSSELTCPFCSHRAPVREFLSLAAPTRPARVQVRVVLRRRATS